MRRLALLVVAGLVLAGCGASSKTHGDGNSAAQAEAQIKSAYQKFFSGKTSVSERAALLQNGSTVQVRDQALREQPAGEERQREGLLGDARGRE